MKKYVIGFNGVSYPLSGIWSAKDSNTKVFPGHIANIPKSVGLSENAYLKYGAVHTQKKSPAGLWWGSHRSPHIWTILKQYI